MNWRLLHNLFFTAVFFLMVYLLYRGFFVAVGAIALCGIYTEFWKLNEKLTDLLEKK